MAKLWRDRVAETTSTTGTGTVTGAGAIAQYQDFSAFPTGSLVDYTLLSGNSTDWETGEGTVTISGSPTVRTISRDTIHESSNAGAAISLTGTSKVFCHMSARQAAHPFDNTGIPTSASTGFATWRNQGGASVADYGDGVRLTLPGGAGDNLRLRTKSAPTTPYTVIATLGLEATAQNFQQTFLGWDDGTKLHLINIIALTTNNSLMEMEIIRYNSVTSFNSIDISLPRQNSVVTYFIRDDGTTVYWGEYRWGNQHPVTHFSVAKASGFLANYNTICWGGGRSNTTGTSTAYGNLLAYREIAG